MTFCMGDVIRRWRWSVAAGCVLVVVLGAAGCHDPDRQAKQAVREGRLEEFFKEYEAREERRPQQLQAMAELDRELRAEHAKRLNKTLKVIEKAYLKDKKRWMEYEPVRQERVRSVWGGNPPAIPESFKKMTY